METETPAPLSAPPPVSEADLRLENELLASEPDFNRLLEALDAGADPLRPMSLSWSRASKAHPLPLLAIVDRSIIGCGLVFRAMLDQLHARQQRVPVATQRLVIAYAAKNHALDVWEGAHLQGFDFHSSWTSGKNQTPTTPLSLAHQHKWSRGVQWIGALLSERERRLLERATPNAPSPALRSPRL